MKLKRVVSLFSVMALISGMFTAMSVSATGGGEYLSQVTSEEDFYEKFLILPASGFTASYTENDGPVAAANAYSIWWMADVRGKETMPDNFSIRYQFGIDGTYAVNEVYFNYTDNSNYYGIVGNTTSGGRQLKSVVGGEEVVLATTAELGTLATSRDITIQRAEKSNGDVVIKATDNASGGSTITVTDSRSTKPSGGTSRYFSDCRVNGNLHIMDWMPLQDVTSISTDDSGNELRPVITAQFAMDVASFDASKISIVHKDTGTQTQVEIISQSGNTVVFKPVVDLAYNTDYYARFSKDIQSSVNNATMVVDKDKLFTTAPSPIRYVNFKIDTVEKEVGNLVDYAGQTVTVSFDVYNNLSGVATEYMATVAVEKNGKMYAVGADSQSASVDGGATMEIELDIPLDVPADAQCTVYIWDTQAHMQSLYPFTSVKPAKDNNITYYTGELNGNVVITGNIGADAAYDRVTLLMFNPKEGENPTFDATTKGEIQYIGEEKADQNGGFIFNITLNTEEYGFFNYYISSSGCTSSKSNKFYYATASQKNTSTGTINGKKDNLTVDDIDAEADILGYNNSRYAAADKEFIVACLEAKLDISDFNETDAGKLMSSFINYHINTLKMVCSFNNIINIYRFVFRTNSVSFKNISCLVMG